MVCFRRKAYLLFLFQEANTGQPTPKGTRTEKGDSGERSTPRSHRGRGNAVARRRREKDSDESEDEEYDDYDDYDEEEDGEFEEEVAMRVMPHSSSHRALHACNCGTTRKIRYHIFLVHYIFLEFPILFNREDPFALQEANDIFFKMECCPPTLLVPPPVPLVVTPASLLVRVVSCHAC